MGNQHTLARCILQRTHALSFLVCAVWALSLRSLNGPRLDFFVSFSTLTSTNISEFVPVVSLPRLKSLRNRAGLVVASSRSGSSSGTSNESVVVICGGEYIMEASCNKGWSSRTSLVRSIVQVEGALSRANRQLHCGGQQMDESFG